MSGYTVVLKMLDIFLTAFLQGAGMSVGIAIGVKVLLHKSVEEKVREGLNHLAGGSNG